MTAAMQEEIVVDELSSEDEDDPVPERPAAGTLSQTYGSILTVILCINGAPCCRSSSRRRRAQPATS